MRASHRWPGGVPAVPRAVRGGGHPEQREPGGGWGEAEGHGPVGRAVPLPKQRQEPPPGQPRDPRVRQGGPRQEYLDAFNESDGVFARGPSGTAHPVSAVDPAPAVAPGAPERNKDARGRALTGVAAAAVTTVLAIVVAGEAADGRDGFDDLQARSVPGQTAPDVQEPGAHEGAAGKQGVVSAAPLTYEQKMDERFPPEDTVGGSGKFDAVAGTADGSGKGQRITYRVDVEQGLALDGELFAEAVHRTLNDNRSWAHNGARTFRRVHSGRPDFVMTLAGPGTTADWCAKSGLDTTVDNVSCDSAATERVMINAFRWAQGAVTYGDELLAYRQMLINHEVGHRLGYNHVTCDKEGDLAPVMQQQTKFLEYNGISCRPNAWAYPNS